MRCTRWFDGTIATTPVVLRSRNPRTRKDCLDSLPIKPGHNTQHTARSRKADPGVIRRSDVRQIQTLFLCPRGYSRIFQYESLRVIFPSRNSRRSTPRTSMRSPVFRVPVRVHSDTPRLPQLQWLSFP